MDVDDRIKFHIATLDRVIGFTRVADAKAAPLLALQASLVAILLGTMPQVRELLTGGRHEWQTYAAWPFAALYGLMASASWLLAARVYIPRTPRDPGSLLYFEEIRRVPVIEMKSQLLGLDDVAWEDQLLRQIAAISTIASEKFSWVRWSFITGTASLVGWIVLMVWVRV